MTIQDCFTSKTNCLTIYDDFNYTFSKDRDLEYHLLCEEISRDTGINKDYIYSSINNSYLSHWHKIDDEWFYFKCANDYYHLIRELIGEVISEYYGLDTVHYKLVKLQTKKDEKYGIISKNFYENDYNYKRVWDYGINLRRGFSVFEELWMMCPNLENYSYLSFDLKRLMIRDFYSSEVDRMAYNFLLKVKDSKIRLAPLFDYSLSFDSVHPYYKSEIGEINVNDRECVVKMRDDYFFQMLLNHLMYSKMEEFLNEVETRHNITIPGDDCMYFTIYDQDMKKLIHSKKLIK